MEIDGKDRPIGNLGIQGFKEDTEMSEGDRGFRLVVFVYGVPRDSSWADQDTATQGFADHMGVMVHGTMSFPRGEGMVHLMETRGMTTEYREALVKGDSIVTVEEKELKLTLVLKEDRLGTEHARGVALCHHDYANG